VTLGRDGAKVLINSQFTGFANITSGRWIGSCRTVQGEPSASGHHLAGHQHVSLLACRFLERQGYQPSSILLRPGLNGYDASVQMRDIEAQEQGKPAYIIAVTALGRSDQRDRGLNE
jgi:hypothetical protein